MTGLSWLPDSPDVRARLKELAGEHGLHDPAALRDRLVALSRTRLDFVRTNALDAVAQALAGRHPETLAFPQAAVRLAVLGSCTMAHLHGAIRVAGLRREMAIEIHETGFGQYWQALIDPGSALHAFRPNAVLFAMDAHHLASGVETGMDPEAVRAFLAETLDRIRACWRLAREAFGGLVLHQLPLPVHPALLGQNEQRLPGSKAAFITHLSAALRSVADEMGVDLIAVDVQAAQDGLAAWHDAGLWHRAKQEISPVAAPVYGDLVSRLLAARRGRSYKCLVLDLDNTLWGGVIGDDGMAGIVLGQGSALGEAYTAFQGYARSLSRRGVILAVCSKNDEATAWEPFDAHPEMVLRRGDIAAFVANWTDKAANLRAIAAELAIGLDSLVFVDDNPFERDLVRRALPMVAVPEIGDDPAYYAATLAAAGYFEGVGVTREDRERGAQYQGNRVRQALQVSSTDLASSLRSLDMQLLWRPFDTVGLTRIVQLINKTNQFNLTTRRYTEADVAAVMQDSRAFGLQLRLLDRFGDNGMIAVVIGRLEGANDLVIDTWLMSCRVLGREVEAATLAVVADQARLLGATRLIGEYVQTAKNAMVSEHYQRLGFTTGAGISGRAMLDLGSYVPAETAITLREG